MFVGKVEKLDKLEEYKIYKLNKELNKDNILDLSFS